MASLRRILGLVVLILGVALIALGYTVLGALPNQNIPPASSGSEAALTPTIYGSGTLSVSWSGAASGTSVQMYSCPDTACSGSYTVSQLTLVASGSGGSGSFSASVQGGRTYLLTESGTAGGLSVSASVTGFGNAALIGVILAVVGAILVVLPSRAPKPVEEAPAAPEVEETIVAPTMAAPTVSAPSVAQAPAAATGSGPSSVVGGAAPGRAPLKCAHCGTLNEPWITNCRWCKRPLSSTNA